MKGGGTYDYIYHAVDLSKSLVDIFAIKKYDIINKEQAVVIMQILKEEIQDSILLSAKKLFLELGYEKSTIDKIAKKVGISKSNLYNYFRAKDEIFYTLTDIAAYAFQKAIDYFCNNEFMPKFGQNDFNDMLTKSIYELIVQNKDGLVLIMKCSVGTKHEYLKAKLIKQMAEKFIRDYNEYLSFDAALMNVISANLFNGITEITLYSKSDEELYQNLCRFIKYHSGGFFALVSTK